MDLSAEISRRSRTGSLVLTLAGLAILLGIIFGPLLAVGRFVFASGLFHQIFRSAAQ